MLIAATLRWNVATDAPAARAAHAPRGFDVIVGADVVCANDSASCCGVLAVTVTRLIERRDEDPPLGAPRTVSLGRFAIELVRPMLDAARALGHARSVVFICVQERDADAHAEVGGGVVAGGGGGGVSYVADAMRCVV